MAEILHQLIGSLSLSHPFAGLYISRVVQDFFHQQYCFEGMSQAQKIAPIAPTIDERQHLSEEWWPNSSDSLPNEQWKKDPWWLFKVYRGWQTTQLYGDYIINHSNSLRILIEQPGFHGKYLRNFCITALKCLQVWIPPCFLIPSITGYNWGYN